MGLRGHLNRERGYAALAALDMEASRAAAKAAHFAVPAGPRECVRVDAAGNIEFLLVRCACGKGTACSPCATCFSPLLRCNCFVPLLRRHWSSSPRAVAAPGC